MREAIIVETDLFEHSEVKSHFINPCCFGEDLAAWVKDGLSRQPDFGMELFDLIQEDYGWGFWVHHGKDSFWVAIGWMGDGSQKASAQWGVHVSYDPGLNLIKRLFHKPEASFTKLRDGIRQVLTSNSAIRVLQE